MEPDSAFLVSSQVILLVQGPLLGIKAVEGGLGLALQQTCRQVPLGPSSPTQRGRTGWSLPRLIP